MALDKQSEYMIACSKSTRRGEKNDCAVIALALATGVGYERAHRTLRRLGRDNGKGTQRSITRKAVGWLGFEIKEFTPVQKSGSKYTPKTIHKFCKEGSFICFTKCHALAVIDGEVFDWTKGRRHRIRRVWKIEKKKVDVLVEDDG